MKKIINIIGCLVLINVSNLFAQELLKIDIESEIYKKDFSINMSDYIETITYCPLETGAGFLIDNDPDISVTNKDIIVRSSSGCFLFERETGNFIRVIGNKGRGPGEYCSTRGLVNPGIREIYLSGCNNEMLKYSFDGTYIKNITIPECNNGFNDPSFPSNYTWLDDNIVFYFENMVGTEKKQLMIINEESEVVKIHPNRNYFKEKKDMSISLNESQFYHIDNELYFKNDYSDTVYRVTEEKLIPKMILDLGKYQPSIETKWMSGQEIEGIKYQPIRLRNLIESDSFFLFAFYSQGNEFQGLYNKHTKQLGIANKNSDISNDIDGFISFSPISFSSDGYLIGYIDAYKVVEWFNQHPEKVNMLPQYLQNLKNVNENDNPVVMIAKLKE